MVSLQQLVERKKPRPLDDRGFTVYYPNGLDLVAVVVLLVDDVLNFRRVLGL